MQRNLNTAQWIDELKRTAAELDTAKWKTERSVHLFRRARRTIVPAIRCVLESMKSGALPVYPLLPLYPQLDYENARDFNNTDPNVLIWCWMHIITPRLRSKAPRDFKPDAGAYDFAPLKTDPHGQLVGADGEVLETVRTENGGLRLSGEPVRITADYDETEMLEHFRHQFGDWADACRAAARLLQPPGERPGTDTENINDQHFDDWADACPTQPLQLPSERPDVDNTDEQHVERPDLENPDEQHVYRRAGALFNIVYGTERGSIPQSYKGAWYIYWLLQQPNTTHSATDLRQRLAAQNIVSTSAVSVLTDHEQPAGDPVEDTADEVEYLKQGAANLGKEIEQARASKDQSQVDRLMRDLQAVKDRIKSLQTPGGRPRKSTSNADRKSVTQAIVLIRRKCREDWAMPQLAKHLECIQTGISVVYPPDPIPDWNF